MKIHPDVLAAHAQFGGDLELMQKAYEHPDLVSRLSDAEERIAELEALLQQTIEETSEEIAALMISLSAAEALLKEAKTALEPFADLCSWLGVSDWSMKRRTYAYVSPNADGSDAAQVALAHFRAARSIAAKIGGKDE